MSSLNIYSASAGSGKTYTLAGNFIDLLITDPQQYAAILAVTFTNKATAEMKGRILENLYLLAHPARDEQSKIKRTELVQYHIAQTGKSEKEIALACRKALHAYLNDFSQFNVSTIDSFFQKIIRSFAYEANLPAGFNVELNTKLILQNAVDQLLLTIGNPQHAQLKKWVLAFIQSRMEEGRKWNIRGELLRLGQQVFSETLQTAGSDYQELLYNKEALTQYHASLRQIEQTYRDDIKQLCQQAQQLMDRHRVDPEALANKSRNPLIGYLHPKKILDYAKLHKIAELLAISSDPESCIHKSAKEAQRAQVANCMQDGLQNLLAQLGQRVTSGFRDYYTANLILKNFFALGITMDIRREVAAISREERLMLLPESTRLLNQIIDENEAPFIYEKTGVRYRHLMIDEFQDTSRLQWNNFKPLLLNSLSQNNHCMVVGDVKQSIYRWRNSDWQLLNSRISSEVAPYESVRKSLQTNWRSKPHLIRFNNHLFELASKKLSAQFAAIARQALTIHPAVSNAAQQIDEAYRDTVQEIPNKEFTHSGYIKIQFPERVTGSEHNEPDPILMELQASVSKLRENNLSYRDICILVRKNKEGSQIAQHLLNAGIPVISNESLLLGSSAAVNWIVASLRLVNDPFHQVALTQVQVMKLVWVDASASASDEPFHIDPLFEQKSRNRLEETPFHKWKGLPMLELCESIVDSLPRWIVEEQVVFVNAFLEAVRNFTLNQTVNLNDFLEWWDEKGVETSIAVPDDQDAVRIMTIHKSKGLQFKAILLPFVQWEIDRKPMEQSLLWCNPSTEPFLQVTPVPVPYTEALQVTHMVEDYIEEKLLRYVDNLNLLYVAFTRAEDILMAWCPVKSRKTESAINDFKDMADMMLDQVGTLYRSGRHENATWNETLREFEWGQIPVYSNLEATEKHKGRFFKRNPFESKLKIHPESKTMANRAHTAKALEGKWLHKLMEQIEATHDIEKVIQAYRFSGQIDPNDIHLWSNLIGEKLNQKEVKEWFSGKFQIHSETPIFTQNETFRPDRVMTLGTEAVVLDYKFGEQRHPDHQKQVLNYMLLLNKMGFTAIKGFVWYFHEANGLLEVHNPMAGSTPLFQ